MTLFFAVAIVLSVAVLTEDVEDCGLVAWGESLHDWPYDWAVDGE